MQVGDYSLSQLSKLSWKPGGQHVLTVREAIMLTKSDVDNLTLDVKTFQDRCGMGGEHQDRSRERGGLF